MQKFHYNNLRALRQKGFTFLEVIIVIAIMSFIALGLFQITTKSFQLREVLSVEGEFYNQIRLAMKVMEKDVSLFYSPLIIVPKTKLQPQDIDLLNSAELAKTDAYWGGAVHINGIRPTRFNGDDSKVSFISGSNFRMYKDSPESEFLKVQYELQDDTSEEAEPSTKILVRKIQTQVFSDEEAEKKEKKYTLLRGIKKFKIQYFNKDKPKDANSGWDSESVNTKNQYPDYLLVTLEVVGRDNLSFEGRYTLKMEMPLRGIPSTF